MALCFASPAVLCKRSELRDEAGREALAKACGAVVH